MTLIVPLILGIQVCKFYDHRFEIEAMYYYINIRINDL